MRMNSRLGTFFVLIGVMLLMLFVFSDLAKQPDFSLLFFGGILVVGGMLLNWRAPAPPRPPSGRFRILRERSTKKKKK